MTKFHLILSVGATSDILLHLAKAGYVPTDYTVVPVKKTVDKKSLYKIIADHAKADFILNNLVIVTNSLEILNKLCKGKKITTKTVDYGLQPLDLSKDCIKSTENSGCSSIFIPNTSEMTPKEVDVGVAGLLAQATPYPTPKYCGFRGNSEISGVSMSNHQKKCLRAFIKASAGSYVAIDIETNNKLTLDARIVSIALAERTTKKSVVFASNFWDAEAHKTFLSFMQKLHSNRITWVMHNATFDTKHLIQFMCDADKTLKPWAVYPIFENILDTKQLVYIYKNSVIKHNLSLKINALSVFGSYGVDFTDYNYNDTPVVSEEFIAYNVLDTHATLHLLETYESITQTEIWKKVYKPSILPIVEMELNGLPVKHSKFLDFYEELRNTEDRLIQTLKRNTVIIEFTNFLQEQACAKKNAILKVKVTGIEEYKHVQFNPRSSLQVSLLLFKFLGLPSDAQTPTGKESGSINNINFAKNQCPESMKLFAVEDVHEILDILIELSGLDMLLSTFMPAMQRASNIHDERKRMHGSNYFGKAWDGFFNLVGNLNTAVTISYRLSSSKPNLQNLPSNSLLGKRFKSLVQAPPGYILWFADFSSLEDRVITIQSKDPNKTKIYTDGFDAHSFNAFGYFLEELEDLHNRVNVKPEKTLELVNSIENAYPSLRTQSKPITFALGYLGTWKTIYTNTNFSEEKSKIIYKRYEKLYKGIKTFQDNAVEYAAKCGYAKLSFSGRVDTPYIKKYHNKPRFGFIATKYEQEVRSMCNAITQTWGTLNSRASAETFKTVQDSPYRGKIICCNTIHDAIYGYCVEDPEVIQFINTTLVTSMQWKDHSDLQSEVINFEAEMDLARTWDNPFRLTNNASLGEITKVLKDINGENNAE